jgi:putative transposase
MKAIHPVALFRYSVLGPLVSRSELARGELKATLQELAARHYDIPGSRNTRLSEKTIEAWFSAQSKIMRSSSTRKSILSADSMT